MMMTTTSKLHNDDDDGGKLRNDNILIDDAKPCVACGQVPPAERQDVLAVRRAPGRAAHHQAVHRVSVTRRGAASSLR